MAYFRRVRKDSRISLCWQCLASQLINILLDDTKEITFAIL